MEHTSSSISDSDPIPVDLLMDILARVPAKSIARFRCVSKIWASILACPDFKEVFLTTSPTRPRILFSLKLNGEIFFFSTPQPQNLDENSSLVLTRYNFPVRSPSPYIDYRMQYGLVYFEGRCKGQPGMIFNPTTGDSIHVGNDGTSYFGYDPINKQYKMLSILYQTPVTYRVLTLDAGCNNLLWRTIEWEVISSGLCIRGNVCMDGVLYFGAAFEGSSRIVCFDVRSEEFDFVDIDPDMIISGSNDHYWSLFDFKGKLGVRHLGYDEVVIWVLDDARGNKWFKSICANLSPLRDRMDHSVYHNRIGMTSTGEIVFAPNYLSHPLYVCFYNIERETFTRVDIQGFEESIARLVSQGYHIVQISLDYVERI